VCGIFASTDQTRWRGRLDSVLQSLRRRGPDGDGSCDVDGVLLAQTRLSIIGLGAEGRQPVTSRDGRIDLVYNGEIFNYQELAKDLHLPDVASDTQLLAEVLARDPELLGRLRGMYAFVAWDRSKQILYAARDPFGIKPLYVLHHDDGELSFASQTATLHLDRDARVMDHVGLGTYLAFGHTGPSLTAFEAVRKVEPGCLHVWHKTSVGFETSTHRVAPYGATTDSLESALRDSVRAHLVADVEVGTFLSGGIDSTLLTCLANQEHAGVRSYTVSFPERPDRDESALAAHNAALMGARHEVVPASMAELAAASRAFLKQHGEPFADPGMLPLTHLSLATGRDLKVVLCGEGADELFGGYARYGVVGAVARSRLAVPGRRRAADMWGLRRGGRPWQRAVEAGLAGGGFRGHAALLDGDLPLLGQLDPVARADVEALASSGWRSSGEDDLSRARRYDRDVWLTNVYLEKTDRATMAGSLEARVPFLDPEVVRAAARVDPGKDTSKRQLRDLLGRLLPGVRLPDRKKGLAIDVRALVDAHFASHVERQLADPQAALSLWSGAPDDGRARRRAACSPYFAFRLAMLDEWQTLFGKGMVW